MKHTKPICMLLVIFLMLSACGNKKAQTKKYYRLHAAPATTSVTTKPMAVVIKRPSALSILGGRPMVATQADGSLVQLSHHFWLESPKVLLQDQIKSWATEHWQDVSTRVPTDVSHQILETRILAFEKQQDQAKIALEFSLYNQDNLLLFNQQYQHSETIAEAGYKSFVQAINKALEQVLSQLAARVSDVN